mgnify:CR=1 FL=1
MIQNAKNWDCYNEDNNTINIISYSAFYCKMDVLILKNSFDKFRNWCLNDFNLDIIFQFLSLKLLYF